ncbi:DUF2189 domain-containing protein [Phenylobacterium sp.]|jgi:uncharacterized membrane protein|uniref:DUF2189 domain-containing protein n=1 Tax=Phenylobacterium sp. TaxID=1871053 RepID=UPI002F3E46CE
MSAENHIRNPFEMGVEQITDVVQAMTRPRRAHRLATSRLEVRRLTAHDLWASLREGFGDLGAYRADVAFVGLIYPVAGLVLARLAYGHDLLPMVFPLASGFALLGPVAALGLYEISRRREAGLPVHFADAFGVVRSPGFGSIVLLSLVMVGIFLLWLAAAWQIYNGTLGPQPPASAGSFMHDVVSTPAGWAMIALGCGVGFLFAVAALAVSVVSFPLLLDRDVGVGAAIRTSLRVVAANPGTMALWGAVIAGSLVIGSLPALVGLIVVVPVLGHATWRLYRRAVSAS